MANTKRLQSFLAFIVLLYSKTLKARICAYLTRGSSGRALNCQPLLKVWSSVWAVYVSSFTLLFSSSALYLYHQIVQPRMFKAQHKESINLCSIDFNIVQCINIFAVTKFMFYWFNIIYVNIYILDKYLVVVNIARQGLLSEAREYIK